MTSEQLVVTIAWTNLAVWVLLGARAGWMRKNGVHLPDYMVTAAIVGTLAASVGGALSALGFVAFITSGLSTTLAAGWRAAMLAAGFYALAWSTVAYIRAARTRPRQGR